MSAYDSSGAFSTWGGVHCQSGQCLKRALRSARGAKLVHELVTRASASASARERE